MKITSTSFDQKEGLCIHTYGYENISKNAHWGKGSRDVYILHYVLEGEGFFNNQKVKSGQGFLITPGFLHEYHSSKEKPWKYFWATFGGDMAEKICQKYISADKHSIFEFNFKPELLNLSYSILDEESPISSTRAIGYFFMLMSYHEKKSEFCSNYYVQEAKKYMKANFYRSISVVEVANSLGINDRYLYNLFIKHQGTSPKKYLNTLKLENAIKMLKTSSCSISEIAMSNGFEDVLAFSRFFSRNMGMSPTVFKRLHTAQQYR